MLDIKFIRENQDKVRENCKNRLVDIDIDRLLGLDEEKRKLQTLTDELRAKRNAGSKGKPTQEQIEEMKKIGDEISALEEKQRMIGVEFRTLLLRVPNMTHPDVRVSDNEDDNPVLDFFGEPAKFDFEPKDHVEIAEKLDLIDFDRAAKVSGAKFYYLKNELALMEFALIQYVLSIVMKHGFTPFITPDLAKQEVLEGLGYNPRGESTQVYNIENSDLCLIGTAEITMGGLHMDEIIKEDDLPKKYVAVSHCFRTEAGAYSKFSKGIFRVHQFTKVEMFQYVTPDKSEDAHSELLAIEREVFEGLEIPFRVVDHCTADLGGPAIRTFDLEAWMPGKPNKDGAMGDWAEVTSTSNCTDYQARGLNIRYKDKNGENNFVHMLNGTAVAVTRALIAILENHQQADGSVKIPEVLKKFMPVAMDEIRKK
ncbi:MAG: serine--tRNA ligase [Candidatus Moranbacteria bacterium]|nr:serine--tRNA ligase [Candidatus Moranbacteria bacterium]